MGEENRRLPRRRCKIRARISTSDQTVDGYIVDVSSTGFRLLTDEVVDIWKGAEVEIYSYELGVTKATVQWRSPGRLGVKIDGSADIRPKLEAYQKYYGIEFG